MMPLQNRAMEKHERGAANGISMTCMSIFKAVGPARGGPMSLFLSSGQESMLRNDFLASHITALQSNSSLNHPTWKA
ncbi:hypothetical protein K1719_034764 [Acacia pycnantha]|nr:hypothetical protein K1719_034764 [Acacia pycnantha]